MKRATFERDPECLRLSSILRRCQDRKLGSIADAVRHAVEQHRTCPTHGYLHDPIVAIVGTSVASICPWCSDPEVLAAWEREGAVGAA